MSAARPIIFSGPMIRALLDGRKQQTRRIMKPQPVCDGRWWQWKGCSWGDDNIPVGPGQYSPMDFCPYGDPGDLLWVRETFITGQTLEENDKLANDERIWLRADGVLTDWLGDDGYRTENIPWKPSIHMPRRASRLTLELTGVRVERLNDISEADALAQGVVHDRTASYSRFHVPGVEHPAKDFPELSRTNAREMYAALWDCLHGSGEWLGNPWVWALQFRVHQVNIDTFLKTREVAA